MRNKGYSYEKIGMVNTGFTKGTPTQPKSYLFTKDDSINRINVSFKFFNRSLTDSSTGIWHYTVSPKFSSSASDIINVVLLCLDEDLSVKRQQLVEFENYIDQYDSKSVVLVDGKIKRWQEPPHFIAKGFEDVWRDCGRSTNANTFNDDRYDRMWFSVSKNHTPHIPQKFEVLDVVQTRKSVYCEF
jgi:hypothetical protein